MKKISYWAKNHIWQTRMLIVVIYILLFTIGISTGKLLKDINVILSQGYFIACIVITLVLWTLYPERNFKRGISSFASYIRRKLFDFSLGAVTFLMIVYTGNNWKLLFIRAESAQASKIIRIPKDSTITNSPLIKNFIGSIQNMDVSKLTQREKIRLIKKQIKAINQDKETSKTNKTLLIILSILVAIGLLIGLAALSCSIACSSSGALAIIVAIAGTALIIFLLVRIIKRLNNPPQKKSEVIENKTNPTP